MASVIAAKGVHILYNILISVLGIVDNHRNFQYVWGICAVGNKM